MDDPIAVLAVTGIGTVVIKAAGPLLLGGSEMHPKARALIDMMAPCLLAALIAVLVFTREVEVVVDERSAGIAAGIVAMILRANILIVAGLAAITTALLRAWFS